MKLKLRLLYSIHATYEIIHMTEPQNISTGPSQMMGKEVIRIWARAGQSVVQIMTLFKRIRVNDP